MEVFPISNRHSGESLKADISFGKVKKTNGQQKKHVQQMTIQEKEYLVKKIQSFKYYSYSFHIKNKKIKFNEVTLFNTLNSKNLIDLIVEYNETPCKQHLDKRVLLRSDLVDKVLINNDKVVDCNLCFVFSIITGQIITAYYNEILDSHKSIDWSRYNENLNIIDG